MQPLCYFFVLAVYYLNFKPEQDEQWQQLAKDYTKETGVDAGIMGYYMYKNKQQFYAGDGIVAHSVDETIQNIGTLGSQGMLQTNDKIIEMMISCD